MEKVPVKQYESEATLALRDVVSVYTDLEEVRAHLEWILEADSEADVRILSGLWKAALITFMKCFGSGSRGYRLTRDLFADLPGEPLEFFDYLKDSRDKYVAHSVSMLEDARVGVLLNDKTQRMAGFADLHVRRVMEHESNVRGFLKITLIALARAHEDRRLARQRLQDELSSIDFAEMSAWPNLTYRVPDVRSAASKARPQAPRRSPNRPASGSPPGDRPGTD